MGIPIPVEAKLDERTATAAANRAERVFADAGKSAAQQFSKSFSAGAGDLDATLKKVGDKASDAYDRARDAAGKLRAEEEKLQAMRERGARNDQIIAQAERLERARRAEIRAIRDATNAYADYERVAESAGQSSGSAFAGGLRGSAARMVGAGQDWASEFAGGFAESSALLRLGAAGGPIGLALAGVATIGVLAGKALAGGIADGMATIQMQDIFQGRMGLDDASMAQYAHAAGAAYANNWGASVADNLATAQVALRSGLIDTTSTDAQVQTVIQQLQGLSTVTDATAGELSRSITTLIRTGLAGNVSDASDIIVAGFQKGLDVSGDWLDTINEYSTQFRKLGLDAPQVLTLLQQGFEGGARDTDKVADSIKEFSIRAVDGSKTTKEGFEALGFNADEMGRRFAAGGETARTAFGAVLDALHRTDDPMQQALIWQRLFGTQWEDMGGAVNKLDLSPAKQQFTDLQGTTERSTKAATDNFTSEWDAAMRTVEQRMSEFKTSMADWFTSLPLVKDLPDMIRGALDPTYFDIKPPPGAKPGTPLDPAQLPGMLTVPGAPSPTTVDGLLLPSLDGPPPPGWTPPQDVPTAGTPTPILTDAQAEAQKEAEKAAKQKPVFDPSQYSLDSIPIGGFTPGVQITAGAPMGITGPVPQGVPTWNPQERAYGQYQVDPQRVFDSETAVISARQSVENARVRVLEMEAEGNHTQAEINAAKTAEVLAERQYQSAQSKAVEAQQGTWKKLEDSADKFTSGMGQIGAALDKNFGITDGLPGIAENLVKMLANLAAAPVVGALTGAQIGLGFKPGESGSGLAGMIAPGLGYGLTPTGSPTSGGLYPSTARFAPSAYPGDAALLSMVPKGGHYDATGDLSKGLADCTSGVEDLVNILDGRSTEGRSLHTNGDGTTEQWMASHGFLPTSAPVPGAFNVGYNTHHMEATLPQGTNVNFGSDAAVASGGIAGAAGAWGDPTFDSHYYRPFSGLPTPAAAPPMLSALPGTEPAAGGYAPLSPTDLTNPALTTPMPVGGGAGTGAFGPGLAGPPQMSLGGQQMPATGGGGFAGLGGLPMAAIQTGISAAGAAGAPFGGQAASAAAQMGIQLINRAAGYAGQVAGIGVSGLLETAFPSGDNPLSSIGNSWLGKALGGIVGARPALPNMAGQKDAPPNPNDPNKPQGDGQGGNQITNNINVTNHQATEDQNANSIVQQQAALYAPPGRQ